MPLRLVAFGQQQGRDLIGPVMAATVAEAVCTRWQPSAVLNIGTCGAWQRHGARVGQVYVASGTMFHDRAVPGDNAALTQTVGNYPVWAGSAALADACRLPMAKVTTGSSFDMTPQEEAVIERHGGRLKEMEAAAVAFVCQMHATPFVALKAVTNLRDAPANAAAFEANIDSAAQALAQATDEALIQLANIK